MRTDLALWAKTLTYEDVRLLILDTVHKFCAAYKQDWEECVSEANVIFLSAFDSYDGDRAAFTTWVRYKIWMGLLRFLQLRMKRDAKRIDLEEADTVRAHERPRFDLGLFVADLSDDAATMVRLVLEPARDILLAVRGRDNNRTRLAAIRAYLQDSGWCYGRIEDAVEEVTEAMTI